MSQSPQSADASESELDQYIAGWRATMRMVARGRSFSGREKNCAFLNCGDGRFADVSAAVGLDFPDDGRALAATDWDMDGDLDFWIRNRTAPRLRLMLNGSRDSDPDNHFIALKLRGTHANTDGIGARVEVVLEEPNAGRLARTVQAGDGFISQSSTWLHFGLGDARISHVDVQWPGGELERFEDLKADTHYFLVEGQGAARIERDATLLALTPSEPELPHSTQRSRAFLPTRMPIPILRYTELESGAERVIEPRERPLLLNLWASWCAPCLSELKELGESAGELRKRGLDVLALSVDEIDDDLERGSEEAREALARISFPFEAGLAGVELLDKLDSIEELLFERQIEFSVPTSLLIDARGGLVAIYRGKLELDKLLADLEHTDDDPTELDDLAVPFPGRRAESGGGILLDVVAAWFGEKYPEDQLRYLRMLNEGRAMGEAGAEPPAMTHLRLGLAEMSAGEVDRALREFLEAMKLDPKLARAHVGAASALIAKGHYPTALQRLAEALRLEPTNAQAWFHTGVARARAGDDAGARAAYEKAVELAPELTEARINLANVLKRSGDTQGALKLLRETVETHPGSAVARYNLAITLQATQDFDGAIEQLAKACRSNPDLRQAHGMIANLLLTHPDPARRDPARSVEYAERAALIAKDKDLTTLRTLTEAYLAAGRQEDALAAGRRALALARGTGNDQAAKAIETWLGQLGG